MHLQTFPNGGIQPRRYRAGGVGNWSGHLPFAYDLVAAVKPKLLVELGTHYGESYFGFCQSVAENGISCCCYAVDTWAGEPHSGFYDESVYRDVTAHNSAHYSSFSYLLRSTFDDALGNFADESIDILHIDGLHTYEAVSHDIRSWLPKVVPGGIVLLHDIMVRHGDFGVWGAWKELAETGGHFAFLHSWGLGVFRKPGGTRSGGGFLFELFDSSADAQEHLRRFYALCATKLEHEYELANGNRGREAKCLVQVFPFGANDYTADRCIDAYADPGVWEHLSIELNPGIGTGRLRIDPANQVAVIDIAGVALRRLVDGETLWSVRGAAEVGALMISGTVVQWEGAETSEFRRLLSTGDDPQMFLPELDWDRFDQPVSLELWLRVRTDLASVLPMLQDTGRASQVQTLEVALKEARAVHGAQAEERDSLIQRRSELQRERDSLIVTCHKLQSELYVSKADQRHRTVEDERERARRSEAEEKSRSELSDCLRTLTHLEIQLAAKEEILRGVLTSTSWRLTAPLRALSERSRGV